MVLVVGSHLFYAGLFDNPFPHRLVALPSVAFSNRLISPSNYPQGGLILFITYDLYQTFTNIEVTRGTITLTPLANSGPFSLATHVRTVPGVDLMGNVIAFIALILVLLGLWSQIVRFRKGDRTEQQQIKWVIIAVLLWAFVLFLLLLPIGIPILILAYVAPLIPIAIAVAILRYRLFDIDLIIQRTLIYGVLTILLALIFFASVTLLQSLVTAVSGQDSPIIIVISTLAIAALFNPLRKRVQNFIDRRFFRRKYNAELILSQFAITTRDEVDLEALTTELLRVTEESLQPESASIWLAPGPQD